MLNGLSRLSAPLVSTVLIMFCCGSRCGEAPITTPTSTLGLEIIGQGTIEYKGPGTIVDYDGDGTGSVESSQSPIRLGVNGEITLTAIADDGWAFLSWTGDRCTGNDLRITLMFVGTEDDAHCTATFVEVDETPTLTVELSGDGAGTVTSDPGGIDCPEDCAQTYDSPRSVTLTATAAPGSVFEGWSGETCGTQPVCGVDVSIDKTVTATFSASPQAPGDLSLVARKLSFAMEVVMFPPPVASPADAPARLGATELVAIDFESGTAHHVDFSDPASPMATDTAAGFCPHARGGTFYESEFAGENIRPFVAFSLDNQQQCSGGLPFGMTGTGPVSTPGGAAAVPGTFQYAYAGFESGRLHFHEASFDNLSFSIGLSGTERSCPFSVAIPNDEVAYVVGREGAAGTSNESCNNWRVLWIVDLQTREVTATVPLGTKPRDLALSPDGTTAYVADFEEDSIYVVDLDAAAVDRTISVGDGPTDVAVSAAGDALFVTNWNSSKVQVIDLSDDGVITEVDSGGTNPVTIDVAGDGTVVVVAHFGTGDEGGLSFFRYAPL